MSPKLSKRTRKGRTQSVSIDPTAFDRFWQAYSHKVGKAAAERVFLRILRDGKSTAEELIAGAERYAAERAGQDPKYTAHAATWLNAGRWTDEAAPRRATAGARQGFSFTSYLSDRFEDDE